MAMVKVSQLRKGNLIKSYAIFNDEKWHLVMDVGEGSKSSMVYLALEGFKGKQFDADTEVERKD